MIKLLVYSCKNIVVRKNRRICAHCREDPDSVYTSNCSISAVIRKASSRIEMGNARSHSRRAVDCGDKASVADAGDDKDDDTAEWREND